MGSRNGPPPMKFGNPGERLRKKRWNLDELPKFEKNFYTEHPEVQRMSQVNLIFNTIILICKILPSLLPNNHASICVFFVCCPIQYEVEEFRRKKEITFRGSGCPKAVTAFHQAQFPR